MIKKFIFLGAPGVGKGTIASLLEKKFGIKHISTGDIFRNEIKNKTELGLKVKSILDSGEYVSDDLTNQIIKKVLNSDEVKESGFILDGYPRTINQAIFLKNEGIELTNVVLLAANNDIIIDRLIKRARGDDDNESVIKHRLKVYNEKTKPLIDFYKNENMLIEISSEFSIEVNLSNIEKELFND